MFKDNQVPQIVQVQIKNYIFSFSAIFSRKVSMECVICTENMFSTGHGACIPCGHVFHLECLGRWLAVESNCPICRKEFTTTSMQLLFLPISIESDVRLEPEDIANINWKPLSISEHLSNGNGALQYPIHAPSTFTENEGNERVSRPVLITRLNPQSTSTYQHNNDISSSDCCRVKKILVFISFVFILVSVISLLVQLNR